MAAKRSLPTFVSIIVNLITLILLSILLFSGLNSRLTNLFWLSTSTNDFTSPSKLSTSSYLTALSNISKTDYTGPPSTAASLGLPSWSSIHLLTSCAHFPSGDISCTAPQYGFAFSPAKHLHLDATSLQGQQSSPTLTSALEAYEKASRFLSAAYTVSVAFSLFAPVQGWFYPAHWAAGFTSGVGGVLCLAATITGTVVFRRVAEGINADLGGFGLTEAAGTGVVVVGFVAGLGMVGAAGGYWVGYRRGKGKGGLGRSGRRRGLGVGGKVGGGEDAGGEYRGAAGKGGLLGRVTGGGHKYVQIDEQTGTLLGGERRERDVPGSPDGIRPSRLDEDWTAPDEYAGATGVAGGKTSSGPGASIPLMALGGGNKQTRDRGTAYEPYTDPR